MQLPFGGDFASVRGPHSGKISCSRQANPPCYSCSLYLLLGTYAAGCSKSPDASTSPPPPKVEVGHPTVREITDEDEYNGWLESSAVVEVRSRVRGHILKIHFKDGDTVQAGQPLFDLDPRPFQVQVDQAIAQSHAFEAQKLAAEKDVARYLGTDQDGRHQQAGIGESAGRRRILRCADCGQE